MTKKILLLFIGIIAFNLPKVEAIQGQTLTVNFPNNSQHFQDKEDQTSTLRDLKIVLKEIKVQKDLNFIYEDRLVKNHKVEIKEDNFLQKNAEDLLKEVLQNTGLKYIKLDAKNYAIVAKKPSSKVIGAIHPEDTRMEKMPLKSLDSERLNSIFMASSKETPFTFQQQSKKISGTVTSSKNNEPLEGVTVIIKGQNKVAYTNENGEYAITVPDKAQALVFSYIGYQSQEIKIKAGQLVYNVTLLQSVTGLDEVIVNGIFERPISNFTGAAQSFDEETMRRVGNNNVFAVLQTLDPSFRMPENLDFGSDPNHLPNIQIRGANSITDLSSSSDKVPNLREEYRDNPNLPLFVLDGFEVSLQKIYDLDMNRIEKVTLLKDATATSIYGSKAANGVVVIKTKAPERGELRLSYTGNFTLTGPDLTSYHLLDAKEKLEMEKAAGIYNSNLPEDQLYLNQLYNQRLKEAERGVNTYWLSPPLHTGFGQKHSLRLEGGNEVIRYGVHGSFNNNTGVMKGSKRNTYSGGTFLSYRRNNLIFQNSLEITSTHGINSPYGSFGDYSRLNPYWRKKDSTGKILKELESFTDFFYSRGGSEVVYNPLYRTTLNSKNFSQFLSLRDNFQMIWQVSHPFRVKVNFSIQNDKNHYERFISGLDNAFANYSGEDYFRKGRYTIENGNSFRYQGRVTLNYGKAFGKNVIYATGGFSVDNNKDNTDGFVAEGFPNDRMDDISFSYKYEKDSRPYGSEGLSRSVGFLGNASYAYDNTYLVDASFRADGSSKFGSDKRFAPFWSVGLGWNIHNENFMKSNGIFDLLKLRASYGSTGSQQFPDYMALTTFQYNTGARYRTGVGANLKGLGNRDLQWEQTLKTNIGLDMNFLDNLVNFTINYYSEKTDGLITSINTPPSIGFSSYKANLGKVKNKGIEGYLTLNLIQKPKKNIFWSVNARLFHNENKVVEISNALKKQNEDQIAKQEKADDPVTVPVILYEEGQSINTIYAVKSRGIDPSTGRELFVRKDGSLTYDWNATDQVAVGNSESKIYGSFGTYLMYKGFSLNLALRTNLGGQTYNSTLANRVENANLNNNVDYRVLAERWKEPGDVTPFKGLADLNGTTRNDRTKATSRFVQDKNILYCDAITLGYRVPDEKIAEWGMSRLQANFYIHDPFVISSIKQERGLSYPFARTYTLSLQVSF